MEQSKNSNNDITFEESLFQNEGNGKKKKVHLLSKLIKKDFWKIISSSIFYIIKTIPVWVCPIIISDVIDLITYKPSDLITRILVDAGLFAFVVIQNIFTHKIYARISDEFLRETNAGIKMALIRKLQKLSITYYKEMENGTIQSKFLRDVENVDNYYRNIIKVVLTAIIGLVVSIGISLFKSPLVTLFFLFVVPINLLSVKLVRNKIRATHHLYRIDTEQLSNRVTRMLEMLTLTKAHGLEATEALELEASVKKVTKSALDVDSCVAWFGSINWATGMLLSGLCLFFTVFLCIKGYLSVGDVVLFESLFAAINNGVISIVNAYPTIASGLESAYSLSEILNSKDLELHFGKDKINDYEGKIEFRDITYSYPNTTKAVLKNLSFVANPKESIAIVGSSGGGKSTLMNLLMGLISPTEGNILIDDIKIDDLDINEYRHHISTVPQNSILFAGTIKENITYGLSTYSEDDLNEVLELANIKEFINNLPNGIDTYIGEHGDKLSGGQKQRISIARALIRHPSVLILDEATSALDNISEYEVEKAISNLSKKCTTFIVAHRLSTIKNADRILVLDKGKIVQSGSYKALSEDDGIFKDLLKLAK